MDAYLIDVDEKETHTWDFALHLAGGDTVASHTVTTEGGVTVSNVSRTLGVVTCFVEATSNGKATCHAVFTSGRKADWSKAFFVTEK